jgi:drug/metabolite transporter (DMT)-like permease
MPNADPRVASARHVSRCLLTQFCGVARATAVASAAGHPMRSFTAWTRCRSAQAEPFSGKHPGMRCAAVELGGPNRCTTVTRPAGLTLAAVAVTVVLWASAFVAIRSAGHRLSPGALALGRLLVGAVVLGLISLVRREGWPRRDAWRGIAAFGVLWFGVYMVALNWGEREVDAGTAAMIVSVAPVLIAVLGGWLLKEGFPARLLGGIAVSCGGAVVVGICSSASGRASLLGVMLCLLAAVSSAVSAVVQKPVLGRASALQVTTFGCAVGAVACLPFSGQLASQLARAPWAAGLSVAYLGVFPTAVAFTTWAYALARTPAGTMGAAVYAVPALTLLMSWGILGEVPRWGALAGGALCIAGVAVSRVRRRKPARCHPARRERAGAAGRNVTNDGDCRRHVAAEARGPSGSESQRP